MGPCQGRYCGPVVTNLLGEVHDKLPAEIVSYRIRAPLKPITLGELASLEDEPGFAESCQERRSNC